MTNNSITAVILAKNEEQMLPGCITCLEWCDQILVMDNGSTDTTNEVAEKLGAKVISFKHSSFARIRNEALKHVTTDWILYIDADERVTPELSKEISVVIETEPVSALQFNRQNYFFGELFKHGGWQSDVVTRLFKVSELKEWTGVIHESPQYSGKSKILSFPLIHFSHRNVADGLYKSVSWTKLEADLLSKAISFEVSEWTIIRKSLSEFCKRYFVKQGYKDGKAGFFESVIQAFNKAIIYIQVWELQQKPSIAQKYQNLEKDIVKHWKNS